jgi:hypothetical protein
MLGTIIGAWEQNWSLTLKVNILARKRQWTINIVHIQTSETVWWSDQWRTVEQSKGAGIQSGGGQPIDRLFMVSGVGPHEEGVIWAEAWRRWDVCQVQQPEERPTARCLSSTLRNTALVHSHQENRTPETEWLITEIYFSQFWRLGSPRSRSPQTWCLETDCFLFCSMLTWQKKRRSSLRSSA